MIFFLKKFLCIIESARLFKLIVLLFLPFLLVSTNAVAQDSYWEYVGEDYNKGPLRCDTKGLYLNWAQKVADFDGSKDCVGEVPDGEVQYENSEILSVLSWTRPYYEPLTKTIRMNLCAQNLRKPTTIRVGADGSVGGPVEALSWEPDNSAVTYAIPTANIEPFGNSFDITVYASDGGTCTERFLARYYFQKVGQ